MSTIGSRESDKRTSIITTSSLVFYTDGLVFNPIPINSRAFRENLVQ